MKPSRKANKIYETLRKDILRRRLAPGMLLPGEIEYAAELGVSRDTLRKALDMLEAEHLVRRSRGHGTYVSEAIPKRKVTFLLPCPDTINTGTYYVANFLGGVQDACGKLMCELETLAVSPTNDLNDIDWPQLFNLNKDSLVIVCSLWFLKIFPFLSAAGCKVVVIREQRKYYPEELAKFLTKPGWHDFLLDRQYEVDEMLDHAFRQGCRRPGFVMSYLDDPENIMPELIRKKCVELVPDYVPPLVSIPENLSAPAAGKVMKDLLKKHHCDCLFINTFNSLMAVRESFPELYFGFFHRITVRDFVGHDKCFYSWHDTVRIAYQAVQQLLRSDASSEQQVFRGRVSEYRFE